MRDLLKFVKDFPVDLIPHMNEQEISSYMKLNSLDKLHKQSNLQHIPDHLTGSHGSIFEASPSPGVGSVSFFNGSQDG